MFSLLLTPATFIVATFILIFHREVPVIMIFHGRDKRAIELLLLYNYCYYSYYFRTAFII